MPKPCNILVIGDSHCGAIKRGWDRIADAYPGIAMTFFASRGKSLSSLCLEGTTVTVEGEGARKALKHLHGYDRFDASQMDLAICVGMLNPIVLFVKMQRQHRLASFDGPSEQFVSEHAFHAAWRDKLNDSMLGHVLRVLGQGGIERGYVTLMPMRSEDFIERRGQVPDFLRDIVSAGQGPALRCLLEECMNGALPAGFEYVPPPETLLKSGILTKAQYSRASASLLDAEDLHDEADFGHMNDDYGEAYLRHLLDRVPV